MTGSYVIMQKNIRLAFFIPRRIPEQVREMLREIREIDNILYKIPPLHTDSLFDILKERPAQMVADYLSLTGQLLTLLSDWPVAAILTVINQMADSGWEMDISDSCPNDAVVVV